MKLFLPSFQFPLMNVITEFLSNNALLSKLTNSQFTFPQCIDQKQRGWSFSKILLFFQNHPWDSLIRCFFRNTTILGIKLSNF